MDIEQKSKILFKKRLLQWHIQQNKRLMPWKGETDAYKIWLSEIILQQTRVQQGWQYYQRFVEHYPTINQLASAADNEVFKLWEGLGYYSRCKNLLFTARYIAFELNGKFPDTYETILQLKGVGPYTAAAIASFAFNLPHAVVDGNVYRVLSRYFGIHTPIDGTVGKQLFSKLATDCLDEKQPAAYNQAIMDFGATICVPANPLCQQCPLQTNCVAYQQKLVALLPVKTKILQKRDRWFTYFIIELTGSILVRLRTEKDIWQNLHEFYLQTSTEVPEWTAATVKQFLHTQLNETFEVTGISAPIRQQLTHQTVFITFIRVVSENAFHLPPGYFWQPKSRMHELAFPKTLREVLQQNFVPSLLF
jgi:A/G-specific adenine glycosylase